MADYLAIIYIGAGSSFAREPKREDAIRQVGRILVSDWKHMFNIKGKPAKVSLYNVEGHDSVYWDHGGVFVEGTNEAIPLLEVVDITLPG